MKVDGVKRLLVAERNISRVIQNVWLSCLVPQPAPSRFITRQRNNQHTLIPNLYMHAIIQRKRTYLESHQEGRGGLWVLCLLWSGRRTTERRQSSSHHQPPLVNFRKLFGTDEY